MATESVDEILDTLVTEYMAFETPDVIEKAKAALDAYYTRECARKVLEIIGEDEVDTTEPGEKINKREYLIFLTHRNQLRAELRAAIEEVGGGK